MPAKSQIDSYKKKCAVFVRLCQHLRQRASELPAHFETTISNPTEPDFYENTKSFREFARQMDDYMDALRRVEEKWKEIPEADKSGLTSPSELLQSVLLRKE